MSGVSAVQRRLNVFFISACIKYVLLILSVQLGNASAISDAVRTQFAFNEAGRPLLPDVDLNNITIDSLRNMLGDFLAAHWRE